MSEAFIRQWFKRPTVDHLRNKQIEKKKRFVPERRKCLLIGCS